MARIAQYDPLTDITRIVWRNGSELDAYRDANQMARGNMRCTFTVTSDNGRPLIQYGPNDQVKRINWR